MGLSEAGEFKKKNANNFSNNFSKRRWTVAGHLERSSRRRGVAWVHEGLDDIHDEAHDHLDRPQRAPGAPQGVICALRL